MSLQVLLLLLLVACGQPETPSILAEHEAKYPEISKKYVYPSLLRLANVNNDPDFEMLIKDIDKIIIYLPPTEDSTYQIKDLRSNLRSEGYEDLVDARTADGMRISLVVDESTEQPHYIAMLASQEGDYILEIDGQINIEYLLAIDGADHEALMNLLEGGF